jgi:hypothetical protein
MERQLKYEEYERTIKNIQNIPITLTMAKRMPTEYQAADIQDIITIVSRVLQEISFINDKIPLTSSTITRFHSKTPPAISIHKYLTRIVQYTSLESACLLLLLIYIDRMCEKNPLFCISSLTVHRFIIACVTVSAKALCDSYCTNSHYAKVGGINPKELNTLELEFLFMIDFRLSASPENLQAYYENLIKGGCK